MSTLASIKAEFLRYKTLGEGAFAQVSDADLNRSISNGTNSIATLVCHLRGNLKSRYTPNHFNLVFGHRTNFRGILPRREDKYTAPRTL